MFTELSNLVKKVNKITRGDKFKETRGLRIGGFISVYTEFITNQDSTVEKSIGDLDVYLIKTGGGMTRTVMKRTTAMSD